MRRFFYGLLYALRLVRPCKLPDVGCSFRDKHVRKLLFLNERGGYTLRSTFVCMWCKRDITTYDQPLSLVS